MPARRRDNNALKYHPERKKGCLRPAGSAGKLDADSRTPNFDLRRKRLAEIFGEKCPQCHTNTKERMADGTYWCNTCNRRFNAL